jgi:hypothetical protein
MKPKLNPNFPTTRVLIFAICLGLFALAIGVSSISTVREALATGRIYSVGIIFDDKRMVCKNNSPTEYWTMVGLIMICCVGGIGFGIGVPIANIRAYIKKLARQKRERGNQ